MTIPEQTTIGHVHLTVSDLDKSLSFYRDILGFQVTQKFGDSAVFISAGGYHHHIGLNTWQGKGVKPQPQGYAGLYHFAILLPTRKDLAQMIKNLIEAEYPIEGASDHGVSEAIYLRDPDNIGVEIYCDRDKKDWPRDNEGNIEMVTNPLDVENLMATLKS